MESTNPVEGAPDIAAPECVSTKVRVARSWGLVFARANLGCGVDEESG